MAFFVIFLYRKNNSNITNLDLYDFSVALDGETKHSLTFFTALNVSYPTWYYGNSSSIRNVFSSMNSAATPPSSCGGGMSGGVGSSGGGSWLYRGG